MQTKSQANLLELALNSSSSKDNKITDLGFARRIKERAEILGITNTKYYYIAEDSLNYKLEIKYPWIECKNDDNIVFYYNNDTKFSTWEHPVLIPFRKQYELELINEKNKIDEYNKLELEKNLNLLSNINDKINEIKQDSNNKDITVDNNNLLNSYSELDSDSDSESDLNSNTNKSNESIDLNNTKLIHELKEKFNQEDTIYWKSQYDELLLEKNRLDRQINRMEHILQKSVLEQSKLHDEKYKLQINNEDCLSKLNENVDNALKYLYERGFHSSGKLRKHKMNVDEPDFIPTLLTASQDINVVFSLFIKAMQKTELDDYGYAKSWEGAIKRIINELCNCFIYDGPNGRHIDTDTTTLQFRIEELTTTICTYGEYLTNNLQRQEYVEKMVRHISKFAPNDTMVPLELITNTINKLDSEERNDNILYKPLNVSLQSEYLDIAPSSIMKMKKDLILNKELIISLEDKLEKKQTEIDNLVSKLEISTLRIDERKLFDENLNNKFSLLTKELTDLKLIQSIHIGNIETNNNNNNNLSMIDESIKINNINPIKLSLQQEILQLKTKIKDMDEELLTSNKRAELSEERTTKLFHEIEEIQKISSNKEVAYQLTISKLKLRCQELKDSNSQQKNVAEGIYKELNKTLVLCTSLEKDRNNLKVQMEMMKGGEANIQKLKDIITDNERRNEKLQKINDELKDDIKQLQLQITKLIEKNTRSKELIDDINVNLREKSADAKRYLDSLDKISNEKNQLINSLTNLRNINIQLNDKLIDIQGNIRVFCRIRPLLPFDIEQYKNLPKNEYNSYTIEQELNSLIKYIDYNVVEYDELIYEYDRVFVPQDNQDEIYDEIQLIIKSVLNGQNICLFSYGQTGSGKTNTLIGTSGNTGIFIRSLETIFIITEQELIDFNITTDIKMSMFEIYNDSIIDLLDTNIKVIDVFNSNSKKNLEIRHSSSGNVYIENLTEYNIHNIDEVNTLLNLGGKKRTMGQINIEEHNSRSHLLLLIKINRINTKTKQISTGLIYMVDLAGSEKLLINGLSGQQLRDIQNINNTFSVLNDVFIGINNNNKQIPYHNSKLTNVLQNVLKPHSSKILMLLNIHPLPIYKNDSKNTLLFGSKCKNIKIGPSKRNVAYNDNSLL